CGTWRNQCQGRFLFSRGSLDYLESVGGLGGGEDRYAEFDDACLFARNTRERVTEPLLMIVLYIGDEAGQRFDNVGRVEPAAQTSFPNHQIAPLIGEMAQRHHGDDFEKSGMFPSGESL